jgi:excisionase family DNA binding protein
VVNAEPEVPLSEAAHRIGVSWHTAYRLVLIRTLEARLVGGRWLVNASSLNAFLKERTASPPSSPLRSGRGQAAL